MPKARVEMARQRMLGTLRPPRFVPLGSPDFGSASTAKSLGRWLVDGDPLSPPFGLNSRISRTFADPLNSSFFSRNRPDVPPDLVDRTQSPRGPLPETWFTENCPDWFRRRQTQVVIFSVKLAATPTTYDPRRWFMKSDAAHTDAGMS